MLLGREIGEGVNNSSSIVLSSLDELGVMSDILGGTTGLLLRLDEPAASFTGRAGTTTWSAIIHMIGRLLTISGLATTFFAGPPVLTKLLLRTDVFGGVVLFKFEVLGPR